MTVDTFREGFESGDISAGRQHLGYEKETDGHGQHIGSDAGKVVSVVLSVGQFSGIELS